MSTGIASVQERIRDCFYIPDQPGIQDLVHPTTGRGVYSGKSLKEMQEKHNGIVIGNFDTVAGEQEGYWIQPPTEITHERFDEMLNVLPPNDWCVWLVSESFKISERTSGTVTMIFCRIGVDEGARYFEMQDSIFLTHEAIIAKARTVMEAK